MPCPTEATPEYTTTWPVASTSTRAYSHGPSPAFSTRNATPMPTWRPCRRASACSRRAASYPSAASALSSAEA